MRKWIDFMAIVALASVGGMGSLLINRGAPIPDGIILSFFVMGITSSMILTKTKYPLNTGEPPTSLRSGGGIQQGEEDRNTGSSVCRVPILDDEETVKDLLGNLCETAHNL
ncbi:MAG: hypothetical protein A2156_02655 [Deltaproteobacteria bacterium RBG_16_48_10]|nr:MAG: hypothetical protein A2156_02655 [Deltaproteobacteria bacterium RBG_16_48_10]